MISLKYFTFNPFQVNCFVLSDESRECLIIDASCYGKNDFENLFGYISQNNLKPVGVLNTHGHVDHLTGLYRVCLNYSINFSIHQGDLSLLENAVDHGRTFGFEIETPPKPSSWLHDAELIKFGNSEITAWHAPGHSPGSMIFYNAEAKFLITGDVLFAGSIGRTDLPGGSYQQLIQSIRKKILVLPPVTIVYPGHGPATSIGEEKANNPFLNKSY